MIFTIYFMESQLTCSSLLRRGFEELGKINAENSRVYTARRMFYLIRTSLVGTAL